MIWFFERNQEALWIETSFDDRTTEYVINVSPIGGPSQIERYRELKEFDRRIAALRAQYQADHWHQVAPDRRPEGWRGAF